jgi:ribosome-associated toxin RatA of RatAB toxin-antitoxin module
MPQVQATSQVDATAEEIFDFLSDYRNIPRLQPHFDSARLVSDQERGLGAVVELKGHFHGVPLTVTNRIITYTPPYRMVSISDGSVLSRNTWELRPLDGTAHPCTQVSLVVEYKVGGPLGRLFTGLASSIFHGELDFMTGQSLHRLHDIFAQSHQK